MAAAVNKKEGSKGLRGPYARRKPLFFKGPAVEFVMKGGCNLRPATCGLLVKGPLLRYN